MITPFDSDQAHHEIVAPLRHEPLVVNVRGKTTSRCAHYPAPRAGWRYDQIVRIVDDLAHTPLVTADAFLGRAWIGTTH